MIKLIEGYDGRYGVDEKGNVYTYLAPGNGLLTSIPGKKATYTGSNNKYLMVNLVKSNGEKNNALVHRLVALAFVPNPNNLPEVDHIDDNCQNNCADNLQWVSRKENMSKVFNHSSPVRNYKIVALYYKKDFIGYFISNNAACHYAEKLGCSFSSLQKYKKTKGWVIESVSTIPEGSSVYDENKREVVLEFGFKN